jgi:hypothetical protein
VCSEERKKSTLAKPVDKMARPCYAKEGKKEAKLRFLREKNRLYLQGSSSKFEKKKDRKNPQI